MRNLLKDPPRWRISVGKTNAGPAHRGVGEFALSKAEPSPSCPFKVGPTWSVYMGTGVGQMAGWMRRQHCPRLLRSHVGALVGASYLDQSSWNSQKEPWI